VQTHPVWSTLTDVNRRADNEYGVSVLHHAEEACAKQQQTLNSVPALRRVVVTATTLNECSSTDVCIHVPLRQSAGAGRSVAHCSPAACAKQQTPRARRRGSHSGLWPPMVRIRTMDEYPARHRFQTVDLCNGAFVESLTFEAHNDNVRQAATKPPR
jgi:hypothetical protein